MPASCTQRATPAGPRSIATPSASSRSAAPQADDAARLPCLHTRPPAPAMTIAARVDTLMLELRSPPVPTMSITPSRSGNAHVRRLVDHRRHEAGQLVDRLPFHAQRDDEPGDLGRRRRTFEDLGHGGLGLHCVEIGTRGEAGQNRGPSAEVSQRHMRHGLSIADRPTRSSGNQLTAQLCWWGRPRRSPNASCQHRQHFGARADRGT